MTDETRTFTSWKLDLQKYILADPRLSPVAKLVAVCILHHLNEKTRKTLKLAAETIADEICAGSLRSVERSIKTLKETGWLNSRKTQTANIYQFSDKNSGQMIDRLVMLKDARDAKRTKKPASAATPMSEPEVSAPTPMSEPAPTPVSVYHLRGNTLKNSGNRGGANLEAAWLKLSIPSGLTIAPAVLTGTTIPLSSVERLQ